MSYESLNYLGNYLGMVCMYAHVCLYAHTYAYMHVCACVHLCVHESFVWRSNNNRRLSLFSHYLFSTCCFCCEVGSLIFSWNPPRRVGCVSKHLCLPSSGLQDYYYIWLFMWVLGLSSGPHEQQALYHLSCLPSPSCNVNSNYWAPPFPSSVSRQISSTLLPSYVP